MKVYVVNYHPANAPQNYETDCQIFLDKKQAEKYKEAKESLKKHYEKRIARVEKEAK